MREFPVLMALCLASSGLVSPAGAQTCTLDFTVEVTQGVGAIQPGTLLPGHAQFATDGRTFPADDGATSHLATGEMSVGDGITGQIWTLVTTARDYATELVGVYAHEVRGLSVAGVEFEGPMALTLYGRPGTRPSEAAPVTQAEWDSMDLRRAFTLHANGADMLAGNVLDLVVSCL